MNDMRDGGIQIKREKMLGAIFAMIATLVVSAYYHTDTTLDNGSVHALVSATINILTIFVALLSIPFINLKKINASTILIISTILIFAAINTFHNYGREYRGIIAIIQWIVFCLLPSNVKKIAFEIFKKMWVAICIIGIICFMLYVFQVPVPYQDVPYYNGTESYSYVSYGISFIFKDSNTIRLCGLCNEPGYLGTLCALFLCADKIRLKKKSNLIILIAGVLTSSVAFFIIISVYLLLRWIVMAIKEKEMKKKLLHCFLILITLLAYFVVLPNINTGNAAIDTTIQRLAITSEGISGDNRTTYKFDALYDSVMSTDPLFGKGYGYILDVDVGANLSYKVKIVEYGIIGCTLIWGTLLLSVLYRNTRNREALIYIIVFFASIYQRPNIITLPYLLLLIGGLEYIKETIKNDKTMEIKNENS